VKPDVEYVSNDAKESRLVAAWVIQAYGVVSTAVPFPYTVRPQRLRLGRMYQLAAATLGSPSPLQLERPGNAVIDGIVY
jgi:hypothetical protein